MYWRKSIIYVFTVLLPALMVGISNFHVFPDASLLATLMLVVTAGVAGVFTYFSGDATAKVRRYCILADVAICAILCVNLGGHWILAREVSAARQGVEERHAEEEREERRREAEAQRQLRLKEAEAELVRDQTKVIREERRRLAQLPPGERRSVLKTPPKVEAAAAPATAATIQPLSLAPVETPKTLAPRMTPDEVREKWWWFLTALAIAECAASVLAGVVLSGVLDDGTAGAVAIRSRGGAVIVQDPRDALYPAMPLSAMAHVEPDAVLPIAAMAHWILEHNPQTNRATVSSNPPKNPTEPTEDTRLAVVETNDDPPRSAMGEGTRYTCPDCGGVLFERPERAPQRVLNGERLLGCERLARVRMADPAAESNQLAVPEFPQHAAAFGTRIW